jgi:hypothetical protein
VSADFLAQWARQHPATASDLPTAGQLHRARQWDQVVQDILAVLDQAPAWMTQDTRTAALGDALAEREIHAVNWCVRCRLARSGGVPRSHGGAGAGR